MSDDQAERNRLRRADEGLEPWRAWGPYLSERAWGTVREDYSEHGSAWDYFPHDQARSRAYRWSEDGLAGICDEKQTFCFGLALWNGVDPILKERIFGLAGPEGNHGEDAKECWWYTDSTPTHSWLSWRYHYPQAEFPYEQLRSVNAERGRDETEYELPDTGIFDDDRYWAVTVDYAKAAPRDVCAVITVTNQGPDPASLHVLPTLWFRNTWAWSGDEPEPVPEILADGARLVGRHHKLGELVLVGDGEPTPLVCDNETNTQRLWGLPGRSDFPKDGINDHLVDGAETVNPELRGTKAALHYRLEVPAGGTATIRVRFAATAPPELTDPTDTVPDLGEGFDQVVAARRSEADGYFAALVGDDLPAERVAVVRSAVAGLMWGKQFYHFNVARWLDGDPSAVPPPEGRRFGRNSHWRHMYNRDIISMPDPWEYPWYAAWDLAFQCVALARVDPTFAKQQLVLLLKEWYQHPNGQLPAYEWAFGDVNPPVHAWAALRVFAIDGGTDHEFLARVMHKLLLNFTWWVNRVDTTGNNLFEGGFLGLDNVGPFDRTAGPPVAGILEQSDGTGWMAMYALNLMEMALLLAEHDPVYEDLASKFFEHFIYIAGAAYTHGLWDDEDAFFYDVLRLTDGTTVPLRVRSMVGLLPLAASTTLTEPTLQRLPELGARMRWLLANAPEHAHVVTDGDLAGAESPKGRLVALVGKELLVQLLSRMLDPREFLSPYGLRSLSAAHREEPFEVELDGHEFRVGYEPGESADGTFGGNSNWRGPVWYPVNYLLIEALRRYGNFFGDDLTVEYPVGSGHKQTLTQVADDLSERLVALLLPDAKGNRPMYGDATDLRNQPGWRELIDFPEFFHGDTGVGLGAMHQTGWTALAANLILEATYRGEA
ncbi:glucosidase [Natronosporangium hydrolyticum]|uniref:Glucosidase n=1 Tax=Natronosporangium hydrolyticum TaxID=2811111 RepID=A0A895YKU6_9ACTN|nr:glucosidase [Natronosporangium hydrolyticum]QSB16605.1 glucosidase [Natronosporangium hydrolyticum]